MIKTILISFSGGKTSAYMTWWLLRVKYKATWDEILKFHVGMDELGNTVHLIIIFANTSKENEETLDFVRNCDEHFGFNTIWIEAVIYPQYGKGNGAKIIDFVSAKRKGEVFKQMIVKHGIPNMASKHCTRELKATPIRALMREKGFAPKQYETAIGYRIDEPKRWKGAKKRKAQILKRHLYYFVDEKPVTKLQVNGWWDIQEFNLMLDDYEGNCTLCYKKSEPKLIAFICKMIYYKREDLFWGEMEKEFEQFVTPGKKHNKKIKVPIYFYRGHSSYEKLKEKALILLKDIHDEVGLQVLIDALINNYNPKQISLCSESCEPF